jgi:hypothetical protein
MGTAPSTPTCPSGALPRCYLSDCTCDQGHMPGWIRNGDDAVVLVLVFGVALVVATGVGWASRVQERRRAGWEVD